MSDDINVGAISEALNNKVDLNQLNTSSAGLSYGSSWGMPSDNYEDLTLGASGSTYIAPANGYYAIKKVSNSQNQYIDISLNSYSSPIYAVQDAKYSVTSEITVLFPIHKGETCEITYNAGGATTYFRFIYAQGEEVV